ncbi:MAG TPA: hypothetical protein VFI03_02135 [Solirubrobacterales bacterium]|nr:hypothetical protein [Solirubrobacterales bacterium]
MTPSPALVVPVQLDALSVNASLLGRDGFRWWRYDYSALDEFASPEPLARQSELGGGGTGVYLHWVVPEALRRGAQDPESGAMTFPRVPNRWLLTRFTSAPELAATAWVIESDCPYSPASKAAGADIAQTSMYLVDPALAELWARSPDPCRNTVELPPAGKTPYANIGVAFPLASWSERDPHSTFLTALAPGNAAFPIFTPHNRGVFSFYDDMAGVAADAETVSYALVGWYSDADEDPLAGWAANTSSKTPYADALTALGWQVAGKPSGSATRSLYQGFALEVAWQPSGSPPSGESDPLAALKHSTELNVAVGNTTIDAFTALLGARTPGLGPAGEQLLRAFQYDLLPQLDEVNGEALLERSVREAWFSASAGGYRWEIVAAEGADPETAELTLGEQAWLGQLNGDQEQLDLALGQLYGLQWRFHELWWKRGRWPTDSFPEPPAGVSSEAELTDQLDPAFVDSGGTPSVAKQLLDALAAVRTWAAKVPQPATGIADPQQALEAGIAAFATARGLALQKKALKAVEAPRYRLPNDPVVVLSGVEPPAESASGELVTRLETDLVASLTVDGAPATPATLPDAAALPSSSALPSGVAAALAEWLLLDPANADAIAAAIGKPVADVELAISSRAAPAYAKPLPALGLGAWVQPWQPMYLEWEVAYLELPASEDGVPQWSFDGDDYACKPSGTPAGDPQSLSGTSLLSPHAQFVLGSQLQKYIGEGDGDSALRQAYAEVFADGDQLPVLAQALTGFNAQLATRDQRAMRRPDLAERTPVSGTEPSYSVAELAGFPDAGEDDLLAPRYRGAVTTAPFMDAGVSPPFNPVRQGQMWFTYLAVYDKFGRVLTVVEGDTGESGLHDAANFPAIVDEPMQPATKLRTNIESVAELPPRILQPARLDFDLPEPVCGWLLPNHIDRSLLLFGPAGAALGELRLVIAADETRHAHWDPPPHSAVQTQADLAAAAPQLAAAIAAPALAEPAAFEALLSVIDTTLWTTDPLGGRADQALSVLIGRPLALVRADLAISLQTPPWRDSSWAATFAASPDAVLKQPFPVRLGDLATRDDGLVGYFAGGGYDSFNSVAAPPEEPAQSYVREIGATLPDGTPNYLPLLPGTPAPVTMLLDPRAGVHATSGVLPVARAELPPPLVAAALRALEVTFRLEPALTYAQPTPAVTGTTPAQPNSVVLPVPSERAGTWTFWDREPGWTPYGLLDATADAELKPYPASLRDGLLQLQIDLDEKPPPR